MHAPGIAAYDGEILQAIASLYRQGVKADPPTF